MYGRASSSRTLVPAGPTEFDILKASHKFLREDDGIEASTDNADSNANAGGSSWGDRLAQKYYESLYREFAVCDLKHYKSGNFALRWRTEGEVINGAGEETCGNTRCPLHLPQPSLDPDDNNIPLKTVELPFAYEEHGEHKSALVKVVLCEACLKKLMWKREREKKKRERRLVEDGEGESWKEKEKARTEEARRKLKETKEERRQLEDSEEPERRLHEKSDRHEKERSTSDRRKRRSRSPSRHQHRRKLEDEDKDKDKARNKRHEGSPSS